MIKLFNLGQLKPLLGFAKSTFMLLTALMLVTSCAKKDDSSPAPSGGSPKYGFQMASGGQRIEQGKRINLKLTVVNASGVVISAPASVSYTVDPSSLGTVVNGVFVSGSTNATGTITARMTVDGVVYTSVIPVAVAPAAELFHVIPEALVWSTNAGDVQLESVYFGTQSPGPLTYAVVSGSAVSVTSNGLVSFSNVGFALIRVSTTIGGRAASVDVPVLVVGLPAAPLPVARVACAPNPVILFRGETQTLQPSAFNGSNVAVTGETFTYEVINKDTSDTETGPIVTVSAAGVVAPVRVGNATIIVTCKGISTQVEAEVLPDKVIINNPFYSTLGTDLADPLNPVTLEEFTATATTYTINQAAYRSKDYINMLTVTANPSGLVWFKPTFPDIPQLNALFDIVDLINPTVASVLVRRKSATSVGTTFVISFDPQDLQWTTPGVTVVTVNP